MRGIQPGYEQKDFSAELSGQLRLVASPDGSDGSLLIHQDTFLYAAKLDNNETLKHHLASGRTAYVHVARGELLLNDMCMQAGDGASIKDEPTITLNGDPKAEILLFDLP